MKKAALFFLIISFLGSPAQAKTQIITGFKCWFGQYSSGTGEVCVITKTGKKCFEMIPEVKLVNFNAKNALDLGAEYKITVKRVYHSYERKYGNYVTSIVFTGKLDKSTKVCDLSD